MAHHKPQYIQDRTEQWYWRCTTCGETNGMSPGSRQEAEDAAIGHARKIELVRANLFRGRGSLTTERDHARRMLDDPNTPSKDLPQWQAIYDGAVARLGEKGSTADEDAMF